MSYLNLVKYRLGMIRSNWSNSQVKALALTKAGADLLVVGAVVNMVLVPSIGAGLMIGVTFIGCVVADWVLYKHCVSVNYVSCSCECDCEEETEEEV